MNKNKEKKAITKNEKLETNSTVATILKELGPRMDSHIQRNLNTNHINYKIQYLLHDPFIMMNAYAKINKNESALIWWHKNNSSLKSFIMEEVKIIIDKIKKGTYKFKLIKKTWISKFRKGTKRLLSIPTQSDKVVQEAVRVILEAIYEPLFEEHAKLSHNLNNNYGFRPRKSYWTAVSRIEQFSKSCNIVIEGDIVSGYNNINDGVLIKLLSKRVKDKAFLKFIREMLQSGIMDCKHSKHSLNGIPQGGVVSPLLFNIYMFELDKYVYEEIMKPIIKENKDRFMDNKVWFSEYRKAMHTTNKVLKQMCTAKTAYKNGTATRNEVKQAKKDLKKKWAIWLKTHYSTVSNLKKGVFYVRYANTWIFSTICTKKEAIAIKKKIAKFLESTLKIDLDKEKTKISQISKGYKFLGFEIRKLIKNPKIMCVRQKSKINKLFIITCRTTSCQIIVEPDSKRLLAKLQRLQICDSKYRAKGKRDWLIYTDFQIVQKYSQIMRGIYNYYNCCDRMNRLYRISHILQYSCARTLARRSKITMSKIFERYGKNFRIIEKVWTQKSLKTKVAEFTNISTLRKNNKKNLTLLNEGRWITSHFMAQNIG